MIINECEQGSIAWMEARLGIPTASGLSNILTPKGKLSASREPYMSKLLAEYFTGDPYDNFQSEWMERGKVFEDEAFAYYAALTDHDVRKVGIIHPDERKLFGASPDGLCDPDGGLELKCPLLPQHLLYLASNECPRQYWPQVQGSLWASGRDWWDFMSYHPGFPSVVVRVEPDPDYQAAISENLPVFIAELMEKRERLIAMGVPGLARKALESE